jgi:hypothetical protein
VSPLALEQREGRIQRFGGLSIRRRLATLYPDREQFRSKAGSPQSPWDQLATRANTDYLDPKGLSPWWVLQDAPVNRYVFNLPQSRDLEKFKVLKEQRLIYRLALGQPNQEDLIDFLANREPEVTAVLKTLALDLSAFASRSRLLKGPQSAR